MKNHDEEKLTACTMRDFCAISAMEALIVVYAKDVKSKEEVAKWSYEMADAMLAERSKVRRKK